MGICIICEGYKTCNLITQCGAKCDVQRGCAGLYGYKVRLFHNKGGLLIDKEGLLV